VHQILGAANVPIFENVAAMERLPAKGTTIFALPMKIVSGSGAPLRIFAILP
jgi:kynurenine formamidase